MPRRTTTLLACLAAHSRRRPPAPQQRVAQLRPIRARGQAGVSCPSVVNGHSFASAAQLRRLVRQENRFGERYLASRAHNRTIGWIKDEVGAIDGFKVRSDRYRLWRWLPRTKAKGRPGLDLARAGGLTVTGQRGDQEGAVCRRGPLVEADGKAGPAGPARLPRPGRGDHPPELRRQGRDPRVPGNVASVRGLAGHRHLHHSRSCERDWKLRAPVHSQRWKTELSRRVRRVPPGSSSRSMCRASRCGDMAIPTRHDLQGARGCSWAARRAGG